MSLNAKKLGVILLAGLVLRLFLFFHFADRPDFFEDDDSAGYLQLAENMRTGHGFSWDTVVPFHPNSFRTPGYPIFLLANRVIFGDYKAALLVQIVLVLATAYLIFLIAQKWKQPRLGLVAAGIFLFTPFSILVSLRFLTQPLFTFFLTLAVWFFIRYLKSDSRKCFFVTVVLLPLLALIRPIAIVVFAPFIITLIYHNIKAKKKVVGSLIFITVFFAGIFPWLWRNHKTFGHFSLSSITSYQLYFYDLPPVISQAKGITIGEAREFLENDLKQRVSLSSFAEYLEYKNGGILRERFYHHVFQSPFSVLVSRIKLAVSFFTRDGIRYWFEIFNFRSRLLIVFERALLAIIVVGLLPFLSGLQKEKKEHQVAGVFLLLIISYFALFSGGVSSAGFRFVVEPMIIIAGLSGWSVFLHNLRA